VTISVQEKDLSQLACAYPANVPLPQVISAQVAKEAACCAIKVRLEPCADNH
jgi:hypothetical protein